MRQCATLTYKMSIESLLLENVGKMISEMEKQALLIRLIRICTIELWGQTQGDISSVLFKALFFCDEKYSGFGK